MSESPNVASLDENIAAYEKMQDALEQHHMRKWVVFYDTKFIDAFDNFDNAAREAVRRYGRGPYLIRQVAAPPPQLSSVVLRSMAAIHAPR